MASRVVMPKLSDTMEEGRILRWIKQEGEAVETGQALAEVETDKATVEMEAYTNGTLRKTFARAGETVSLLRVRNSKWDTPALTSISRGATVRVFVALPVLVDNRVVAAVIASRTPLDSVKALFRIRGQLLKGALVLLL